MENKIQVLEIKYLRSVKEVDMKDRIRNTKVRGELAIKSMLEVIKERQLNWWGHQRRASDIVPIKHIWKATVQYKRHRGTQEKARTARL